MRLTTHGLGHRYPTGPWLFRHLDLDLTPGRVTALVGPSGTGKSTLLAILGRGLAATEGRVELSGIESIARVAQSAHGVASRTALDHVVLPLLARGLRRSEAQDRALPLCASFGVDHLADVPYRQLSGGEAQRLMLARAVAQGADLILADEPTASLDAHNAQGVIDVLGQLGQADAVVVIATHDPRARDACDAVVDLGHLAMADG